MPPIKAEEARQITGLGKKSLIENQSCVYALPKILTYTGVSEADALRVCDLHHVSPKNKIRPQCDSTAVDHVTIFQYCDGKKAPDFVFECCRHYDVRLSGGRFRGNNKCRQGHRMKHNFQQDKQRPRRQHPDGHEVTCPDRKNCTFIEVQLVHNGGCMNTSDVVIQGQQGIWSSLYFENCLGQRQNAMGEILLSNEEHEEEHRTTTGLNRFTDIDPKVDFSYLEFWRWEPLVWREPQLELEHPDGQDSD